MCIRDSHKVSKISDHNENLEREINKINEEMETIKSKTYEYKTQARMQQQRQETEEQRELNEKIELSDRIKTFTKKLFEETNDDANEPPANENEQELSLIHI